MGSYGEDYMRYFTIKDARSAARWESSYSYRTAERILKEESKTFHRYKTYDIFLSHAFSDADIVLGIKKILEKEGFTVYVDWIDDPHLDRSNVTKEVAEHIRQRMKSCGHLVYATSENARDSKWMPWELGFFDGLKPGHVAILPLMEEESGDFKGREYLSLYPVLGKGLPIDMYSAPRRGIEIFDGETTEYFKAAA